MPNSFAASSTVKVLLLNFTYILVMLSFCTLVRSLVRTPAEMFILIV